MWSGFFVTVVTPVLSNQRAAVLRQGGHVLSRWFRYYVPDFSGRTVVQTPLTVRWVPMYTFYVFHWLFLRFRFLYILVAVGCCCILGDGLVLSSWWVLFSSDRDDSFIKLHGAFSVLFAARLRIVYMLVSISWNGNYNGSDLIVLNFH